MGQIKRNLKRVLRKLVRLLVSSQKLLSANENQKNKKKVEEEKKSTRAIIAEQRKRDRNDRRLSRKRARVRLKQIKERIRAEKKAAREIEKNRRQEEARGRRFARGVGRRAGRAVRGVTGGLATAAAFQFDLVGAGLQIANFERRVIQLGEQANLALPDELKLTEAINEASLATGKSRDELLDFVKATFDTGGGIALATQNLDEMAKSMVAFSSDAQQTGALLSSISDFGIKGRAAAGIVDVIAAQAKLGKISAQQFGAIGPELFGAGAAKGFEGRQGIAQLGALAQFAARASSGPESSKTAVVALLTGLLSKSEVIQKKLGIQTTKGGAVVDPFTSIKKIIKSPKATDKLLEQIFGAEAARVLGPLRTSFKRRGGFGELGEFVQTGVGAKGQGQRIFERISETSGFKIDQLTSLITVLTDKALLAGVSELIKGMTEFTKDPDKIRQLVSDFKIIGEAIVSLAKNVNKVMPTFSVFRSLFTGATEEEIKELTRPKESVFKLRGGVSSTTQTPGSQSSAIGGGNVNVVNNFKKTPSGRTDSTTVVTQNNPTTGSTKRTHTKKVGIQF